MAHVKRVPLRKCTGCGEMKPKKDLVRVVKSPEGEISLDLTGRKPGRGAYVCRSAACLQAARKARRLERGLRLCHSRRGIRPYGGGADIW